MKKMKLFAVLFSIPALLLLDSCTGHYWKGADIGWATEYEAGGEYFCNADGERRECTELMKELGLDAVRFRV